MNSTQSLDIMPRFSFAADEEGEKRNTDIVHSLLPSLVYNYKTPVLYTLFPLIVDGMVSNLQRIRIRSNSTGTRPSFRRGASRRIAHQLETPEKPKSASGKVPKSASVSGLSLIITPGRYHSLTLPRIHCKLFNLSLNNTKKPCLYVLKTSHVFTVPPSAWSCAMYTIMQYTHAVNCNVTCLPRKHLRLESILNAPKVNMSEMQMFHKYPSKQLPNHLLQMTQQDLPRAPNRPCPCHLTPHPETHLPAGTSRSASAASGLLWSFTALGRGLALHCGPSESIWVTVTCTLFTTWFGYVLSSWVQYIIQQIQ